MRPRDARVGLSDIVAAGDLVAEFITDRSFEEYAGDRMLSSAVERQLEIVGEALNRVLRIDGSFGEAFPEAKQVIGFRNILAHGYDRVSDALVWSIATESLPALVARAVQLMEARGPAGEER
jgi:uncharacterized protein with HEPN domain